MAGENLYDEQELAYNYGLLIENDLKELIDEGILPPGNYEGTPEDWCNFLPNFRIKDEMDIIDMACGLEALVIEGKLKRVPDTKPARYCYEVPEPYEDEDED